MRGLRSSYFHIVTVTSFGVLKYSLRELPPKEASSVVQFAEVI